MNAKSNNTKTEALNLAKEYLQTLGFNGFSFQTIADSLGIKKASLHYYFSSKEDMGIALLEDYEEGHKTWAKKVQELPSKVKLEKMVKGFCSLSAKHNMICPVGSFTSDFYSVSPKMKKKLQQFHFLIRDWLVETIEQGKKEGTIKKTIDSTLAADLFLTTLQGGVQVARIRGEQESLKKMLEALLDQLHGK
ncbi:TetR/AcrR family transcriptional regulator [Bacteriovorax stolpii]|uniref:TetR/AcrR family transcriptional regulator n=1 Tax=Bacteriovorax stolpii TaxID=960 RepID=A0A2K9NTM2_BACTC|nr:TetR/AcrR family transcriptional regulator [Bacteriovorax stolpii]AUN98873.1 TetR/AcrR family transcriptional regulator [Bacteriovorax stolpii]QDK41132.1 TetR/AcrR family transcriptional regulator [Bacteriovorax stolpii]TDP55607.1 TetR family transcriptional regulator [Bacteriovorax stolpii]